MYSLAQQQRIYISIMVEDDTIDRLAIILTQLLSLLFVLQRFIEVVSDIIESIDFTVRVTVIVFNSVKYGLG